MESIRSKIPPCPGKIVPVSFTPASRLKTEITRSPICALIPSTAPSNPATKKLLMGIPTKYGAVTKYQTTPTAMVAPSPDHNPSQVLLGLIEGASFCLPHLVPAKKATASPIHVVARGRAITATPSQGAPMVSPHPSVVANMRVRGTNESEKPQ